MSSSDEWTTLRIKAAQCDFLKEKVATLREQLKSKVANGSNTAKADAVDESKKTALKNALGEIKSGIRVCDESTQSLEAVVKNHFHAAERRITVTEALMDAVLGVSDLLVACRQDPPENLELQIERLHKALKASALEISSFRKLFDMMHEDIKDHLETVVESTLYLTKRIAYNSRNKPEILQDSSVTRSPARGDADAREHPEEASKSPIGANRSGNGLRKRKAWSEGKQSPVGPWTVIRRLESTHKSVSEAPSYEEDSDPEDEQEALKVSDTNVEARLNRDLHRDVNKLMTQLDLSEVELSSLSGVFLTPLKHFCNRGRRVATRNLEKLEEVVQAYRDNPESIAEKLAQIRNRPVRAARR
ncbi:hypothetical protein NDN08_001231 [Rhodosorus marinus]|uniref:Uncharacterized protein n=1 Tax=Rhodosorus marinus TaxID=101924 RepID=A0AAV8UQC1_9RHOD|nr:hypothetical protein NDN08_001231 [Rhodosorus marinus]